MRYLTSIHGWINTQVKAGDIRKWVILGVLIGIVAGLGSILIYYSLYLFSYIFMNKLAGISLPHSGISGGTPGFPLPEFTIFPSLRLLLIPLSTTLGGLFSGFLVYRFAPETEGHGTDAAIDAFHNKNGRIRRRVPLIKMLSSAITIGSGGSAGREGPTAQIAAGFGSFVADVFTMSDRDRRIAMASGIGAGIGSIFMAPLGGALLSSEILYRKDFEVEALIPSFIASVTGYSIFGYMFDYRPIFTLPAQANLGFFHPASLLLYLLVGILAGVIGIGYVKTFYWLTSVFRKMNHISVYFRPAIGGLAVGIIAMYFPEVMGLGYGWVQQIFYDGYFFPLWLLITLVLVKIVATSFTIGSGGSGGVFAPGLVTGAFLGGAIGIIMHPFFPFVSILEVTIVCMIAFFGGISKAPLSVIIMGTEMTQSYTLFLPLMLATVTAYFISGKSGIYSKQVDTRADSPAHAAEYQKPIMEQVKVYEAYKKDYIHVSPDATLKEALSVLRESRTKSAVVEVNNELVGYLSLEEIREGINISETLVKEVMIHDTLTITKDDNIHMALDILSRSTLGKLVVVDQPGSRKILGTIGFPEIAEAYNREIRRIKSLQS